MIVQSPNASDILTLTASVEKGLNMTVLGGGQVYELSLLDASFYSVLPNNSLHALTMLSFSSIELNVILLEGITECYAQDNCAVSVGLGPLTSTELLTAPASIHNVSIEIISGSVLWEADPQLTVACEVIDSTGLLFSDIHLVNIVVETDVGLNGTQIINTSCLPIGGISYTTACLADVSIPPGWLSGVGSLTVSCNTPSKSQFTKLPVVSYPLLTTQEVLVSFTGESFVAGSEYNFTILASPTDYSSIVVKLHLAGPGSFLHVQGASASWLTDTSLNYTDATIIASRSSSWVAGENTICLFTFQPWTNISSSTSSFALVNITATVQQGVGPDGSLLFVSRPTSVMIGHVASSVSGLAILPIMAPEPLALLISPQMPQVVVTSAEVYVRLSWIAYYSGVGTLDTNSLLLNTGGLQCSSDHPEAVTFNSQCDSALFRYPINASSVLMTFRLKTFETTISLPVIVSHDIQASLDYYELYRVADTEIYQTTRITVLAILTIGQSTFSIDLTTAVIPTVNDTKIAKIYEDNQGVWLEGLSAGLTSVIIPTFDMQIPLTVSNKSVTISAATLTPIYGFSTSLASRELIYTITAKARFSQGDGSVLHAGDSFYLSSNIITSDGRIDSLRGLANISLQAMDDHVIVRENASTTLTAISSGTALVNATVKLPGTMISLTTYALFPLLVMQPQALQVLMDMSTRLTPSGDALESLGLLSSTLTVGFALFFPDNSSVPVPFVNDTTHVFSSSSSCVMLRQIYGQLSSILVVQPGCSDHSAVVTFSQTQFGLSTSLSLQIVHAVDISLNSSQIGGGKTKVENKKIVLLTLIFSSYHHYYLKLFCVITCFVTLEKEKDLLKKMLLNP